MNTDLCAEMLGKLKPKLWKWIAATLILVGISHSPFESLAISGEFVIEDIMMGVIGIVAVVFVWLDYYKARKTYLKYENEIAKLKGAETV